MRRFLLVAVVLVVAVLFFFAPFLPVSATTPAGPLSGGVSPSFMLFQCGSFVGGVTFEVPSGAGVGGHVPFWVASSNWNCQYLHW